MAGKTPTVLVLHPEEAVRGIVCQLLDSCGLKTVECFHGEEAVELALIGQTDAILFAGAPDMKASLLVEQIRYGGAITGIICCLPSSDPEHDRIDQDARTRILQMPFTLKQTMNAVAAVSPACRRAIEAKRRSPLP